VAVREGNNILGVHACDPNKPPVAIRYLVDPAVPGADVTVSSSGDKYTVCKPLSLPDVANFPADCTN